MSVWNKVKSVLKVSAPLLANAIAPGAGGAAVNIVSGILGCNPDPISIENQIATATPTQLAELKTLSLKHKELLIELSLENEKAYLADKQNARKREMEIVKATGKRDFFLPVFTIIITAGFFGLLYLLSVQTIPYENRQMVNIMLGTLGTCFVGANTYYFGTSKSSSDKNKLINK